VEELHELLKPLLPEGVATWLKTAPTSFNLHTSTLSYLILAAFVLYQSIAYIYIYLEYQYFLKLTAPLEACRGVDSS